MPSPAPDAFYANLPVFRDLTQVMDPGLFKPLPGDWLVGTADVVQSTKAIAENRYKAVNMAGAAVIAGRGGCAYGGGGGRGRRRGGDAREILARDDADFRLRERGVRLDPVDERRAAGRRREHLLERDDARPAPADDFEGAQRFGVGERQQLAGVSGRPLCQ